MMNSGITWREIAAMPTFEIEFATNKHIPIGGVIKPIIKLKITMMPKWIGSIPKLIAIGCKIGIRISMAAMPSRNRPMHSKIKLTNSRNTIGLVMLSSTCWLIICGTCEKVSSQFATDTTAIKINTIDESRMEVMKISGKSLIFNVLKTNIPIVKA